MRYDKSTSKWAIMFCLGGLLTAGPASRAVAADDVFGGEPAPDTSESIFEPAGDEAASNALPEGQTLEVGSFGQIDLHVEDLELAKVLQVLSFQSRRNIIVSRNVAGTISADLYDVDFYEALDAVLHANGFGYVEKGDFIYVYTADEIQKIAEDNRTLNYEVIDLNYITAADASTMVSPLLSAAGSIAVNAEVAAGFQPTLGDAGENLNARGEILAINDYAENVEAIRGALAKLDVRPKQVMIEAAVLSARLTEDNAWGVDMSVLVDFDFAEFANPLSAIDDLLDGDVGPSGEAFTSTVGNTRTGKSGVRFGIASEHVTAFVRALQDVTDVTVLAKPRLLVLNRQRAELLVGQRLGYVSTTQAETTVTQTVEFLDVGTQLTVRPFVSNDDMIRMELRPSISDGQTRVEAGFVLPDQTAQELVTNVLVQSGQTVLIGGLFKEDTTISRSQVPGLGDLPVVGAAFKGQDDTVIRNEVIFLVTPTIVKDQAIADAGRRSGELFEQQRLGMVEGLLPWSRTKVTHDHMREAVHHHEMGDDRMALHYLDMALTLDPTYAQARDLKREITGEQMQVQDRSIAQTAIEEYIRTQDAGQATDAAEGDAPAAPVADDAGQNDAEAAPVAATDTTVEQAAEAETEAEVGEAVATQAPVGVADAQTVDAVLEPVNEQAAETEAVSDEAQAQQAVDQWIDETTADDAAEQSAQSVSDEAWQSDDADITGWEADAETVTDTDSGEFSEAQAPAEFGDWSEAEAPAEQTWFGDSEATDAEQAADAQPSDDIEQTADGDQPADEAQPVAEAEAASDEQVADGTTDAAASEDEVAADDGASDTEAQAEADSEPWQVSVDPAEQE